MRLISIIGEDVSQIVPVLYAYREKFAEHTLVSDAVVKERTQRLARGMRRFSRHFSLEWQVTIRTMDERDLHGAQEQIIASVSDFAQCWLNITDAYPILSMQLGEYLCRSWRYGDQP